MYSSLEQFMWFAVIIIMIIFLFLMVSHGVLTNDEAATSFYCFLLSSFLWILLVFILYLVLEISKILVMESYY